VRNYGRDRKALTPLIRLAGTDEVKRRVGMFFMLPAQYWGRTVVNFVNRFNAIPAAAGKLEKKPHGVIDYSRAILRGDT
jgi:hypothetical protein